MNDLTIKMLKSDKNKLEGDIKSLIEDFIYNTNTVPKNMEISIRTVASATKKVVFTESVKVTFDLEI